MKGQTSSNNARIRVFKGDLFSLPIFEGKSNDENVETFEVAIEKNYAKNRIEPTPRPVDRSRLEWLIRHIESGKKPGHLNPHLRGSTASRGSPIRRDSDPGAMIRKYAECLRYVPFVEFEESLKKVAKSFNDSNVDPYILLPSTQKRVEYKKKSNYWVAQIAYKHLHQKPIDVREFALSAIKEQESGHFHFLLTDDGSFSGKQIVETLQSIDEVVHHFKPQTVRVSIIVPFVTEIALSTIAEMHDRYQHIDYLALHYVEILAPASDQLGSNRFHQPLVYFDHKMPDSMSTDTDFLEGLNTVQPDGTIGFIKGCFMKSHNTKECPLPPYKLHNLK
jgi:hypothetical protein